MGSSVPDVSEQKLSQARKDPELVPDDEKNEKSTLLTKKNGDRRSTNIFINFLMLFRFSKASNIYKI